MSTPVDDATRAAMAEALADEYKARATYRKIIERFGPVRPFVNIVESEDRHVRALLALYDRFGVEPPADDWADRVAAPASLREACADGVAAEIENQAMYDRLMAAVSDEAVLRVFERLRDASLNRHLPAFRRCLERESGEGGRRGGGRGRGGRPDGQG